MTRSSSPNSKINPEKLRICRHQTPWNQKGWTQEFRLKFRRSPTPGRGRAFPTCGDWTWRSPRKKKKNRFQSISVQALSTSSVFCQLLLKCFTLTYKQPEATRYFRKTSNMKNGNKSNKERSRVTTLKENWQMINRSLHWKLIHWKLIHLIGSNQRGSGTQREKPTHSIFTHPTLEVSRETLQVSFSSSFKLAGKVINLNLKKEVKKLYNYFMITSGE